MKKLYGTLFLSLFFFTSWHVQAQLRPNEGVKNILRNNLIRLNLTRADLDDAIVSNSYKDDKTNIQYVYLQQTWKKIKVYNRILTVILKGDSVLYSSGKFADKMISRAGSSIPAIPADQAIFRAAQHLQLAMPVGLQTVENKFATENKFIFSPAGLAKTNIETELLWVVSMDTIVRLAWNVNVDVLHSPDWWNVRVDAGTGNIIEKNNWTVDEGPATKTTKQETLRTGEPMIDPSSAIQQKPFTPFPPPTVTNASYFVVPFPFESPNHHAMAIENEPWLKAGVGNPSGTNGWQYDGTTDYTVTRGNNVFAYLDASNTNTANAATNWPDTSTTPIPSLTFNFPPDFNLQPGSTTNKRTAIANLFYWNNMMHDVFYQYGFNEASGNFQTNNLGRGGLGNDHVLAEGQDASGTSNANFSTPVDGQRPRMQMYLWSSTPALVVNTPAVIAGSYPTLESSFSTANKLADLGPVTGQVIYYNDDAGGTAHLACAAPANVITGKIALIDRATCNFTVKVKNAQDAGAIAVIMVNNVAGGPIVMGGTDNTITIPAVMISQGAGALIAPQLNAGVTVTITGGIGLDGDLDNSVICHEYGHGISSRLTGGPANSSCLSNTEKGSEGWSDYMALMMVTNWQTATVNDGVLPRTIGTYAANEPITGGGIRNYPYSTNISINPLVYSATMTSEAHNLGEYWCMALWEMTWEMIQVDGINTNLFNAAGTGGNSAALKLVIEGMKLQPCNPGFIDARNAILKADTIFFSAHYSCAIWRAFAKRGMGKNASQGSSNSVTDQVPDFSVGTVLISVHPVNTASCTAATANFSVTASGFSLTYQWQVSTNGGSSFNDIAGAVTSTLTLNTVSVAMNNNQYRCVVNGVCGSNATSTAGTLTVTDGPAITSQPTQQTGCAGGNATFNVAASGPVLGYQWQLSTDGGNNFTNIAGATSATLTLNAITSAMNNNQYRCIIGATCGSGLNSNAATLIVNSSVVITTQPLSDGVCIGDNASFTISVTGSTPGYQWQVSTNAGASFSDIGGQTTSTLSLSNVTAGANNNQYRCILTGTCTGATSEAATLTVFTVPAITTQPANGSTCAGSDAEFSVVASGPIVGYQWQVSTDGGTVFNNISGATAANLTITAVTPSQDGNLVRCIITGNCDFANSNSALLTVKAQPVFTLGNTPSSLCVSDTAITLSASLAGGTWTGSGVQGIRFTPSVAGVGGKTVTYTVTNDIGCTLALSSSIQVSECPERHIGLGSANSLVIYPNPSDGKFNVRIHTDLYTKLGIKIYGSDGKWVRTLSLTGLLYDRIMPVDISNLPNGAYFLYFYNQENGSLQKRTFGIVISR